MLSFVCSIVVCDILKNESLNYEAHKILYPKKLKHNKGLI